MTEENLSADVTEAPVEQNDSQEATNTELETDLTQENDESSTDGEQNDAVTEEHDVVFPKKAVNAISRRDKTIGRLKAQNMTAIQERDALLHKIKELESSGATNQDKSNAPNEDDFDTYGDFQDAKMQWMIEQNATKATGNQQGEQKPPLTQAEYENQERQVEREGEILTQYQDLAKTIPDLQQTLQEYGDVIGSFNADLENMIIATDNPTMALYNLAQEGKLEQLATMPLQLAAVELVRAQGKAYQPAKKVTQAPKPLSASNGSGTKMKSINDLSSRDLVDRLLKAT